MSKRMSRLTKRRGGLVAGQRRFILSVSIPTIIYSAGLSVLSIVWAFALMFFEYSAGRAGGPILGLGGNNPFVGLEHFRNMIEGATLEARLFRTSLGNTLIFAFAVLPLNLVITLPLAALVEAVPGRLKNAFRAIYFLPAVTSSVGVALVWGYIYHAQQGLLNAVIRMFGGPTISWLADPRPKFLGVAAAMWAVTVAYLWQDYGYNMVIFVAALQGIPKDLREAAMIDGANAWQAFRHVTVPLLRPTLLFVCVMTMLSSFQVFDIIQVMTDGGPQHQTRVLVLDIYLNAFRYQRMGWAAAVAFVLLLVVVIITVVQMRLLRTEWEY
jgi:multiple sugar transport system permease protein